MKSKKMKPSETIPTQLNLPPNLTLRIPQEVRAGDAVVGQMVAYDPATGKGTANIDADLSGDKLSCLRIGDMVCHTLSFEPAEMSFAVESKGVFSEKIKELLSDCQQRQELEAKAEMSALAPKPVNTDDLKRAIEKICDHGNHLFDLLRPVAHATPSPAPLTAEIFHERMNGLLTELNKEIQGLRLRTFESEASVKDRTDGLLTDIYAEVQSIRKRALEGGVDIKGRLIELKAQLDEATNNAGAQVMLWLILVFSGIAAVTSLANFIHFFKH